MTNGRIGVVSLNERFSDLPEQLKALPSRVAGLVPRGTRAEGAWDVNEWLGKGVSGED